MIHRPIPVGLALTQCGKKVPSELTNAAILKTRLSVSAEPALEDVFNLSHRMEVLAIAEVAPDIVRLDKPPDDALPDQLSDGTSIYTEEKKLHRREQQAVFEKYYAAFYQTLAGWRERAVLRFGLDCRLFDDTVPAQGNPRAILCLSNGGDIYGEPKPGGPAITCPAPMLRDMRDVFSARFADMAGSVLINDPVSAAYVAQREASEAIPWAGLHIAQSLVMGPNGTVSEKRLENLRDRFENILVMICKIYEWM